MILGRVSVKTATEIDTREDKCTDSYRDLYRRGQVYRQLQRLMQERTRVQTATEINTGGGKCTDSYRDLILERTSVHSYRGRYRRG